MDSGCIADCPVFESLAKREISRVDSLLYIIAPDVALATPLIQTRN